MSRCRPRPLYVAALIAASLFAGAAASADGVRPDLATPLQREQAQSRFFRARELMGRSRYAEALAEFHASREIVASPNTRLEMARCLRAEGKLAAAYAELERTEAEAKELVAQDGRYQRAYEAALAERAELETQIGFVVLTVENPADSTRVLLAGKELQRAAWSMPAPVDAGSAEVLVETSGREPIKRTILVVAGQKASLAVDARSDEAARAEVAGPSEAPGGAAGRPRWLRTGAYVAGGVAVAGLATFTLFGLMARSTYDHLGVVCAAGPCPADRADEISSGKTNQTIANVGLAFGLVGAAAGATMFVLSVPPGAGGGAHASSVSPGPPRARLFLSPAWVGWRGDF